MGVPSFYRWLVKKYPKIVADAAAADGGGDGKLPEFDNLYLDMNGIIHPCFHPDDNPFPPTTFEEVFGSMHEYIDLLFDIVKPRKLLFMAIDGVAPRAKMNQQRSRRFRAAKDAEISEEFVERLRKQFENEGKVVLPKEDSELSDSNVITPGTEFMHVLSKNLRSYINQRMKEDLAWGDIKVILSDDKAPGEGEHKIMSFIRAQRASSEYDPNTRHCLYGLDADLIMLALATHEVHFSILREHPWQPSSGKSIIDTAKSDSSQEARFHVTKRQAYQFLNVSVLREYLALDMEIPSFDKFEFDLERIIDDFIFICFFAGNDFLPHIPSIEIHERCIDLLMDVYKKEFQKFGGYLVNTHKVDDKKGRYIKLKRVEKFILAVGAYEERIFSKRTQIRDRKLSRTLAEYRDAKEHEKNNLDEGASSELVGMHDITHIDKLKISAPAVDADTALENTKELKQKLKDYMRHQSDLFKDGNFGTDKVRLSTPGWRERYYKEKFSAENTTEMELMRKSVAAKFVEGLCWVLLYYFSGVPSWIWFYPYHYGPFASDFGGISRLKVKFQKGSPFKPFDQLMGVLPPRSSHALPLAYKGLMVEEKSELIDFYPTEFATDVDGKRFLWQGTCKLPFIDEERLLMETRKVENELKDQEKIRNEQTPHQLFLRRSSELRQQLLSCRERKKSEKIEGAMVIESEIQGIKGTIHIIHDLIVADDDKEYSTDDISMFYEIPQCFWNVPYLLEGVNIPEKTVNREDLEETILWHEHHRNGTWQNNHMSHYQKPDVALEGEGRGFSFGRGKTSVPQENPKHNCVGSFAPSYRNKGYAGHQQSAAKYIPRAGSFRRDDHGGSEGFPKLGSNHCATSSYRPHGSNAWQPRGGGVCEDWRARRASGDDWAGNYAEVTGQRQYTSQSFAPNGGRGRGRGRGQGWSATKS